MTGEVLVKIVAARPHADGLLPEELVANIRVQPQLLRGKSGREMFLGLAIEGSEKVYEAMDGRNWFGVDRAPAEQD